MSTYPRYLLALVPLCAACGPSYGPPTCDGGGEPLVELGEGGRNAFVPWSDGDAVPVSGGSADLELWTSGLDTGAGITTVVRISVDGGPSVDSLASLTLVCADSGNGWTNVLANLPAGWTSGSAVTIDATLTDAAATTVTTGFSGIME